MAGSVAEGKNHSYPFGLIDSMSSAAILGTGIAWACHSLSLTRALRGIPLADVQAGGLFDALTGQHENSDRACIGWVNRRIGAFEPSIEAHEFLFVQAACADVFGFGRNARAGL